MCTHFSQVPVLHAYRHIIYEWVSAEQEGRWRRGELWSLQLQIRFSSERNRIEVLISQLAKSFFETFFFSFCKVNIKERLAANQYSYVLFFVDMIFDGTSMFEVYNKCVPPSSVSVFAHIRERLLVLGARVRLFKNCRIWGPDTENVNSFILFVELDCSDDCIGFYLD